MPEVTADQGEQVRGLGVRILPHREMARPARELAALDRIAVREKDRCKLRIGLDAAGVGGEHVRPVGEEGDAPEALGLALGAEHAARAIEALQRLVCLRVDEGLQLERERTARHLGNGERGLVERVLGG